MAEDDLANILIPVFENDATQLGKFLQPIRLRNQFVPE
jgi:hypothetical protein